MPALLMGVAVGIVCFLACTSLKSRFKYDDSLDAFGVHGVGGTLGAILTGVFATRATGAVPGRQARWASSKAASVLTAQIIAVVLTWVLAIVATFVILKVLDAVMGLRVSRSGGDRGPRPQPTRRRRIHLSSSAAGAILQKAFILPAAAAASGVLR